MIERFNVYEGILEGLREAIAYERGDHSLGKVSVRQIPVPEKKPNDIECNGKTP